MALITRFSRLMKADVHAMLDRIEEPAVVLRQAVRDMQEGHQSQQRRIGYLKTDVTQRQQRIQQFELALGQIEPQLDDCFAAQREDLARGLIQRRLELTTSIAQFNTRIELAQAELTDLQSQQRDNEIHLQSMLQKLEVLTDTPDSVDSSSGDVNTTGVSATDVDIAFVQEKQRRSRS